MHMLPTSKSTEQDSMSDIESRSSTPSDLDCSARKRERSSTLRSLLNPRSWRPRSRSPIDHAKRARRRVIYRWLLVVLGVLSFFGIIAAVTYVSFVAALIHRLNPPKVSSGLEDIVNGWKEPDAKGAYQYAFPEYFSRDIVPKNCHSHNDYWRSVPLYQALAAGCVGVEADIWLQDDGELLVGHAKSALKPQRTLRSLYLDPLQNIMTKRNVSTASTNGKEVGIFDVDANQTVVLLIDMKTDGHDTFPALLKQLEPLYKQGFLTYFDGKRVVPGPVTVVGTGNTPFDLVTALSTDRFIFFDAPLTDISNKKYTTENSYYASVQLNSAVGHLWFNRLSGGQVSKVKDQISAATNKGLMSRYWDTPSWPISFRDKVWSTLTDNGVGMLNVDDLISATRWNWNWCVIAGIALCGSS